MDSSTAQRPTADQLSSSSSASPTSATPLEPFAASAPSAEQSVEAESTRDATAAKPDDQQASVDSAVAGGDQPRFSAEEKGKGKAVEAAEEAATEELQHPAAVSQADPHYDAEAHELAESLSAVSLPASPPILPAPVELSPIHSTAALPPLTDEEQAPLPLPKEAPPLPETEVAEERWPLKSMSWPPLPPTPSSPHQQIETMGPTIKIVCQNLNGPCSFIALCNVLILRGDIHILPPTRTSVTYSFLSALVGDHLLRFSSPKSPLSLEAALSILPSTRYGLDLNPRFGHIDGFCQSGEGNTEEGREGSGELALFAMSRVPLLHGWVVDPQDEQTWDLMVEKTGDYDAALMKIVEGQVIAGEQVEDGEEDEEKLMKAVAARSLWSPEQEEKVQQAHLIQKFLSSSRTQLTYHGLFLLSSHLAPSSLSALFRNSHLSVLFRRPSTPTPSSTPQLGNEGPTLFTLVTDESFANEPDVVWESLEDVEGGASEFYDGALRRSAVRGGDWVRRRGQSQSDEPISREQRDRERERTAAALEGQRLSSVSAVEEVARYEQLKARPDNDYELAGQLQKEENCLAQQQHRDALREDARLRRLHAAEASPAVLSPGALSIGPEALAGREERRGTAPRPRRDERGKKEGKDKCVMS